MATITLTPAKEVLHQQQTKLLQQRPTSPLTCCQSAASSSDSISAVQSLGQADTQVIVRDSALMNGNGYPLKGLPLKGASSNNNVGNFPKRPPVDLEFEDVTFGAYSWSMTRFQRDYKEILHGVSGEFKSGELSAIMGPSGAGKSTLLNILAGYTTRNSGGKVKVNGVCRDNNNPYRFRKLLAYIPQDEELRPALTVIEAMTTAAHLKLGYSVTLAYKMKQITEVLELLGLEEHKLTLTGKLSGGQRKRLAIALELLSNPPILFLDEPTTGLDSSSCSQCISLLKRLAQEGRTIVCTIHQPSALLFDMFDKLYALADGRCIFQGPVRELVPHLASEGLQCPPYHNPADFLMEVAIGEHGTDLKQLAEICAEKFPVVHKEKHIDSKDKSIKHITSQSKMQKIQYYDESSLPPASWVMQLYLLYRRNILTARRCYPQLLNRLLAHICIGLIFGYLYQNVGEGANTVLANYVYMYGSLLLVVYTGKMSVTLSFPMEMNVLSREHFNRWYKLTPYLLSVILLEIPFQILCTWSYIAISYWLTGQPCDFRLFLFVIFCTLCTLCAQSWGYFIGATTPIKIAVFLGPVLACLFSIFGFCIRYNDTPSYFRWLFHISYFRAGFHGIVYSIYGIDRLNLDCPEDLLYCHYIEPKKFLKEMDIQDVDLPSNMSLIIVIGCLMHALTFTRLWYKLNKK